MDLDMLADRLGCAVVRCEPPGGRWGAYDAASRTIYLHPRLGPAQRRSVLAHEIGHHIHRHHTSTPRAEAEADAVAHWLTIPLCMILKAAQSHPSVQAVAHELELMPEDVEIYVRRLLRQG